MFVMDSKIKGDFVVREHYMSLEELSNQFAFATEFLKLFRASFLNPNAHSRFYFKLSILQKPL